MRQHELEAEIHRLERLNSRLCADIHAIITEQDSMYKLVKDNKDTRGKQSLLHQLISPKLPLRAPLMHLPCQRIAR